MVSVVQLPCTMQRISDTSGYQVSSTTHGFELCTQHYTTTSFVQYLGKVCAKLKPKLILAYCIDRKAYFNNINLYDQLDLPVV